MKLLHSPTSPFARKVRAVIIEKGLEAQIQEEVANPMDAAGLVSAINPLGKVPALLLDDGRCIVDSPIIAAYLDSLSPEPRLVPAEGPERWTVLNRQALADGVMDSAVALVFEDRRPEEQQSALWIKRWTAAITRTMTVFDHELAATPPSRPFDLGWIAVACAAAYLRFRLPELDWPTDCPHLQEWLERISERPSLMRTAPPAA